MVMVRTEHGGCLTGNKAETTAMRHPSSVHCLPPSDQSVGRRDFRAAPERELTNRAFHVEFDPGHLCE
jgi:hypothetical protein